MIRYLYDHKVNGNMTIELFPNLPMAKAECNKDQVLTCKQIAQNVIWKIFVFAGFCEVAVEQLFDIFSSETTLGTKMAQTLLSKI